MKNGADLFHDANVSAIADMSSIINKRRAKKVGPCNTDNMKRNDEWRARLQAVVDADGRSLRDISLAAGLSHGYLHGILRDNKEPTLDRFQLVCKEMGVSATKVLLGVDVSPEAEAIMKLLDADPDVRAAVLALLERLGR